MSVSVVIPAYNAAAFVCQTLDSVRAQTCTDFEMVIVDDGSTDATGDVVEQYLSKHGIRGRVVRQANRGIAAARNAGMRAASGTHIALLDHDDLWHPEKLAAVVGEFDRDPGADLICHDENITRNGKVVRTSRRRRPRGDMYEALLFGGNLLSPSATTFRRDRALELGGFDERLEYLTVEDYDFWMRFSRNARIRFLGRVLGEYVLVDGAASRRIVFHHLALERMLRRHLEEYSRTHRGFRARWRTRRRLAQVYRSAARQLMAYGESAAHQQMLVGRMLRTFPVDPKNLLVALLWIMGTWRQSPMTGSSS
jgi:glycosyltransferase involved in cell wall biosynthesis